MYRIHVIIILTFLYLIPSECFSQGIIFSQFENAPLNLNPAMTGDFEGDYRVGMNYRNEWSSFLGENSYKTGLLSADTNIDLKSQDQIGLGVMVSRFGAGSVNYRDTELNLLSSYTHYFGDRQGQYHSLTLGTGLAIANKSIKSESAIFPGQFPDPEPMTIDYSKTYFNLSSGIKWDYHSNSLFAFQLGLAFSNLNRPNTSFFNGPAIPSYINTSLHGNLQLPLTKKLFLKPSFVFYKEGTSDLLILGSSVRYLLGNSRNKYLQLGIWTNGNRDSNTGSNLYIFGASISLGQIAIGLSYDHVKLGGSPSTLNTEVYEISLSYTFGEKGRIKTDIE